MNSEDGETAPPVWHTNGGLSVAYTPSKNGDTASPARHTNGSLSVAYTPKSVSQVSCKGSLKHWIFIHYEYFVTAKIICVK